MKKTISYRQKIIELARIYQISRVFDKNLKLTTYEIELELLKNKVPIPSRRGYFSHKIINEVLEPLYVYSKEKLSIDFKLNRSLKKISNNIIYSLKSILSINLNLNKNLKIILNNITYFLKSKLSINFNLHKNYKIIFNNINNYIEFVVFNINNFFKVITKTVIDSLNNIYNFEYEEKLVKKIILRGTYSFLVVMLVASGLYIKSFITDVDGLKISVEIKSDKKKIAKTPKDVEKKKSKDLVKKPKIKKKPYDPENDYTLNTQTVLNLFEDLEYDLDHVRRKKLVKPIYFTRLPKDLDAIRSNTQKKETFLQILLPLVVAENEKIQKDRTYLLKILKENQSEKNTTWIKKKYKEYRVSKNNIDELIEKIDIIPTSIALAQAAKESGWGTSRFALEGNAIYGQWTWNGDGMAPLDKDDDKNHQILKFPLLRASVKAYISNLNSHPGYKSFRKKRLDLRNQNKNLSGLDLIHELDNYAQTGKEYTKVLEQIIKQNDLDEFETVEIDDFKEEKELKL
jgi:Bax protein